MFRCIVLINSKNEIELLEDEYMFMSVAQLYDL